MSHLSQTLQHWLEEFFDDLARRGYSAASAKTYRCDLGFFVDWVDTQDSLRQIGDLTTACLEDYQLHLMLRPSCKSRAQQPRCLSISSRNRHLAALKSFFRYLKKACYLLSDPSAELESARQPKTLPKAILTVPEMARLLTSQPQDTPLGLRDLAALELLYGAAVRRNELLGLQLGDLRLDEGLVCVLGKGQVERMIPMGEAAGQAVQRYLREGRPLLLRDSTQSLLLSKSGGPVQDRELLAALRRRAQQVGIRKKIGYHLFRHTAATHLLRGGADIRDVQVLLGHAQINTTVIYTRVDLSDLKKVLARCHPREQNPPPS